MLLYPSKIVWPSETCENRLDIMTELNNKVIQFNDFSFKEQRQIYVNVIGKYFSTFIEDSRKRKSTTKIELIDEDV